jgi:rod shape-determining protein MreD
VNAPTARPLNPMAWLGVPLLLCVLATVLLATPIRIFGQPLPEPVFPMAPVFAWALIRPSVLAPFAILLMGLFLDLFWGGPMGMWSLALLTGYAICLTGRSMLSGQSRLMMWLCFGGACAITMLAAFLFVMFQAQSTPNPIAVAWQLLATILLYPFAHYLVERYEDADVRFR